MDKAYYEFHREGLRRKFYISIIGLVLGVLCILGGLALVLHGAGGQTSWTASVLGLSSTLNDAPPGVVLFVVGIFVVWITRFRVEEKREEVVLPTLRTAGSEWREAVERERESGRISKGFIKYGGDFLKPKPGSIIEDLAKKEAELQRPREDDDQKQ